MKKWTTVDSKILCSSDFLSVTEDSVILPNGKQIGYNTIKLWDFVSVVPIIGNDVAMIEILRYPRNCLSLEIPSGHIESNETPQESAARELLEETGYTAGQLSPLCSYNPLSRSLQMAHLFLATELTKGTPQLEETEQIKVKLVPLQEIPELLNTGKIVHAPTIIGLQKLLLMKQNPK
jgi:ADP-ribose pyrophosphatase